MDRHVTLWNGIELHWHGSEIVSAVYEGQVFWVEQEFEFLGRPMELSPTVAIKPGDRGKIRRIEPPEKLHPTPDQFLSVVFPVPCGYFHLRLDEVKPIVLKES